MLSLALSGDEQNWGIIKLGVLSNAVIDDSVLIAKMMIIQDNIPNVAFNVVFYLLSDSSTELKEIIKYA